MQHTASSDSCYLITFRLVCVCVCVCARRRSLAGTSVIRLDNKIDQHHHHRHRAIIFMSHSFIPRPMQPASSIYSFFYCSSTQFIRLKLCCKFAMQVFAYHTSCLQHEIFFLSLIFYAASISVSFSLSPQASRQFSFSSMLLFDSISTNSIRSTCLHKICWLRIHRTCR